MKIEVAGVETRLASAADPEEPVQVGLIAVAQCARVVGGLRVLTNPRVEDPASSGSAIMIAAMRSLSAAFSASRSG